MGVGKEYHRAEVPSSYKGFATHQHDLAQVTFILVTWLSGVCQVSHCEGAVFPFPASVLWVSFAALITVVGYLYLCYVPPPLDVSVLVATGGQCLACSESLVHIC